MHDKRPHPGSNALLASLPDEERNALLAAATTVTLESGVVIADAERPLDYVYFPTTCVLSVLSLTTHGVGVETAVIGYEGMAPMAAFHGVERAAEQVIVQVPGEVVRLPLGAFRELLATAPVLSARLHHFAQALFTFVAQSSACNRQHSVAERCARWLLTTHDRVPDDEFPLTHLFLSQMLGVRRSSVTIAAELLRARGTIAYSRGSVTVEDRALLESGSCECYAIIRSTYDRILSDVPTPSPLESVTLSKEGLSLAGGGSVAERRVYGSGRGEVAATTLDEFRGQLHRTRDRRDSLRAAVDAGEPQRAHFVELLEELSVALEQMHVAEEEMRVQMEALRDSRGDLERQQALWRARFDGLPDGFIETDRRDTIVEVNQAAEELLGQARQMLIGKPLTVLFPEHDRRELRAVLSQLRSGARSAHWTGTLLSGRHASPGVGVAVAAAAVANRGTARSGAPYHGGGTAYAGARWLLRPTVQYRSRTDLA